MKQNETFDQEREDLYHTDEEDEESQTDSSVPSTPLSRNGSNNVPVPWPRSYRQSMDLVTGVTPPTSTSFISSFRQRRQSYVFGSFTSSPSKQQLLIDKDEIPNSVVSSIKSFLASHLQLSVPGDPQENRSCTFSQSVLNGINVLCGVALLTMPYAVKEGGWLGPFILFSFGTITFYTVTQVFSSRDVSRIQMGVCVLIIIIGVVTCELLLRNLLCYCYTNQRNDLIGFAE